MLRTRNLWLLVSLILASLVLANSACTVQKGKEGSKDKVDIQTPIGALKVDTAADAKDTGLSVYPGAKLHTKEGGKESGANVNIASSMFGVKVVALEYTSDDTPDKIRDYYKKELARYGTVLDCPNGVNEHGDQLSCSDHPKHGKHGELVVGTKQRQRIVSVEPNGSGSKFALVYVQTRGEEGSL